MQKVREKQEILQALSKYCKLSNEIKLQKRNTVSVKSESILVVRKKASKMSNSMEVNEGMKQITSSKNSNREETLEFKYSERKREIIVTKQGKLEKLQKSSL